MPRAPPSLCTTTDRDMGMTITVYSKPACVQCTATTRALDMRGLEYRVIDLTQDAEAMQSVTEMGYRQVPVVVAGDAHWAGFRPDMIGQLA
jgi:glutaredoxin-like protein NrdH